MPAYQRLEVDERREQLLALGQRLFAEHTYDELSMAAIAREAGISKALLYHYFPRKQAYFAATLQAAAADLQALVEVRTDGSPAEQLTQALEAYLSWIETNAVAYTKLLRSVQTAGEVREIVERVRAATANRVLAGLTASGAAAAPPPLRAAVRGWLWFMDGACLDWIEHGGMSRGQLKGLLLGTLMGAVTASGEGAALERLLHERPAAG